MGRGLKKETEDRKSAIDRMSFENKIVDSKLLKKSIREARDKYNSRTMNAEIIGVMEARV